MNEDTKRGENEETRVGFLEKDIPLLFLCKTEGKEKKYACWQFRDEISFFSLKQECYDDFAAGEHGGDGT